MRSNVFLLLFGLLRSHVHARDSRENYTFFSLTLDSYRIDIYIHMRSYIYLCTRALPTSHFTLILFMYDLSLSLFLSLSLSYLDSYSD